MGENVHEEFPLGFQQGGDFRHQQGIVLHVLEELDAEHAIEIAFELCRSECEGCDVAGDDFEVREVLLRGEGVDVEFLRAGVGESGYVGFGKAFGEVEG